MTEGEDVSSVLDRFRKANPESTENKVQDEAASYTNDLYGGQNLKRLGATAASQDFQNCSCSPRIGSERA